MKRSQSDTELRRHKDEISDIEGRNEKLYRDKNENYNKLQEMTKKLHKRDKVFAWKGRLIFNMFSLLLIKTNLVPSVSSEYDAR